jgi:transcriptional regulator with XRE-family HTH domain
MTPTPTPLTPLEHALAGVLRAERARLGLSLDDIAKRSEQTISRVAYNRLEKGERHADLNQLEACARALGITLTHLLMLATEQIDTRSMPVRVVTDAGQPTVAVGLPPAIAPQRPRAQRQ